MVLLKDEGVAAWVADIELQNSPSLNLNSKLGVTFVGASPPLVARASGGQPQARVRYARSARSVLRDGAIVALAEVPLPEPGPGEVRVRVTCTGMYTDVHFARVSCGSAIH